MILCDDSWESPAPGVGAGLDPKPLPLPWRSLSFKNNLASLGTSVNIYSIYGSWEAVR